MGVRVQITATNCVEMWVSMRLMFWVAVTVSITEVIIGWQEEVGLGWFEQLIRLKFW